MLWLISPVLSPLPSNEMFIVSIGVDRSELDARIVFPTVGDAKEQMKEMYKGNQTTCEMRVKEELSYEIYDTGEIYKKLSEEVRVSGAL